MNVAEEIRKTRDVIDALLIDAALHSHLEDIAVICEEALHRGNKIMFCGNGGSAADAQHLAAELVGKLNMARPPLAAVALTTDTSALTAIGNDYGFDLVFSRQVAAIGREGDVLIAISTSGCSMNVRKAIEKACDMKITTIGLTGEHGGKMKSRCNYCICIPSRNTQKIQEGHIVLGHILCGLIEQRVFG